MRYYGKPGIILVSSCGQYYLISNTKKIELNETGAFYWRCLCDGMNENELMEKVSEQYDIDHPEQFREDIDQFINSLVSEKLLYCAE